MRKPEAKYKYLLNQDKYDPEVKKAVSRKSISHNDANKINAIQEMMAKEREEKGSRNIVTSENRADFMAKKLGLEKKNSGEGGPTEKPHGIYHAGTDELHSHFPTHDKAMEVYKDMRKNYDYAIGELSEKELKKHGYK
jgi:hypothetical protein